MPTDCSLCNQPILITEEYIRLLDCHHLYHRLCLIRRVVEASQKRFFMTRREQKIRHEGVKLCQDCGDDRHFKGYRKHIIFDLLKEKADLFYKKMLDRKLMEE
jgi:hypothetical protein